MERESEKCHRTVELKYQHMGVKRAVRFFIGACNAGEIGLLEKEISMQMVGGMDFALWTP